jgi:hypothetical protein
MLVKVLTGEVYSWPPQSRQCKRKVSFCGSLSRKNSTHRFNWISRKIHLSKVLSLQGNYLWIEFSRSWILWRWRVHYAKKRRRTGVCTLWRNLSKERTGRSPESRYVHRVVMWHWIHWRNQELHFGGEGLFYATLRGPGTVYIQSLQQQLTECFST